MKVKTGTGVTLPLVIALGAGLLSAALVHRQLDRASAVGGAAVKVLVATQPVAAGHPLRREEVPALFTERAIPEDFAPLDAVADREKLIDSSLAVAVEPGAIITNPLIMRAASADNYKLRPGERAVSIGVRVAPDGVVLMAGDRVDLVASGFDGAAQSELVLSGAQILIASESEDKPGLQRLTLRVAARQAAALIRADVFAREIRAIKVIDTVR